MILAELALEQPNSPEREAVDLWLVPGSSNHRRLFSFLWRRKNFKKETGSRMEWEVIHRVALQPHIIYILMIACFTSPQILLQNASRFIYILVNHSCFTPLAGKGGPAGVFLGLCWLPGLRGAGNARGLLRRCERQGARLMAWALPSHLTTGVAVALRKGRSPPASRSLL